MLNVSTRMPTERAAQKCPSSCIRIMTPSRITTQKNGPKKPTLFVPSPSRPSHLSKPSFDYRYSTLWAAIRFKTDRSTPSSSPHRKPRRSRRRSEHLPGDFSRSLIDLDHLLYCLRFAHRLSPKSLLYGLGNCWKRYPPL